MSRVISYTSEALDSLQAIAAYIDETGGGLDAAEPLLRRLKAKCELLAELPGVLGTSRPDLASELRSTPCGSYVIFFRYQQNTVQIVDVLHGSRNTIAHFPDGTER